MISEQFMQLGRWDLRLSPDTPVTVRQMIGLFDQIVITPTRTPFGGYPAEGFETITSGYEAQITSILDTARYRGPVLEVGNKQTELSGHGMLWYLGNSNGSGPQTYSTTLAAKTWAQHLTAFIDNPSFTISGTVDGWNGLTKTAGTSLPAGTWPAATATDDDLPLNVLQRLTMLAGLLGVEFYVDPQGNFQHCGSSALFNTTPQVILMAGQEGRDLDLIGLRLLNLDRVEDGWTAVNVTFAVYKNSATSYTHSGGSGSLMWDASGATTEYAALETISDSGGSYTTKLNEMDGKYETQTHFEATVDAYDPGRWMRPGDYVWAYDPVNEIYDNTQATTYHGMHVTPSKLRLYGMDWSVRQGMGVYLIPGDHGPSGGTGYTPAVLDLTDYVMFEDSPCRLDLGAWRRSYDQ